MKGEQAESELHPFIPPTKKFSEYLKENNNDKTEAVKQYIKENFTGKYITTIINNREQEVLFTGRSVEELRKYADGYKAYFIEDIPNVLQHYKDTQPGSEKHKKDFPYFHYFEDVVEKEIKGKKQKAKITVHVGARAKSRDVNEAYFYAATKIQDTKKVGLFLGDSLLLSRSSNEEIPKNFINPTCDENIRPQYEIVNINTELLEEKQNAALNADSIKKEFFAQMREVKQAVQEVKPLMGELDYLAFDSADEVYLTACRRLNIPASLLSSRDVFRVVSADPLSPSLSLLSTKNNNGFKSRFDR